MEGSLLPANGGNVQSWFSTGPSLTHTGGLSRGIGVLRCWGVSLDSQNSVQI